MIKRTVDFLLSLILLLLLFPLMLLLAVAIYFNMGGPVLFKQKRPGLNEKAFIIYKFRTMADVYDEQGLLLPDGQRLTRFGKLMRTLSLDELPQLLNILKGDMSFVGPRALLMEYLPLYNNRQKKRHQVKPGITGWAQINGRNTISWQQKFEYDVWYVENQSLWLDIKILWLTFIKVIKKEGINQQGQATIKKFKGNS